MAKKKVILSSAVDNETLTEDLIVNWLNTEENIHAPKDREVKFARQYPLGNRRPDFVTIYKEDDKNPICIIIEAKHNDLVAAEKQVKEYIDLVNKDNKSLTIIGIGAALNTRKTLKLSAFWKKGDEEIQDLKTKQDLNYLVSQTKDSAKAVKAKKQKIEGWRDKLSSELAQLHNFVRIYCKAPANEKVNLINGIFIALRSEDFKKNMGKYHDIKYSRNIYNAIVSVMIAESHDQDQIQNIKDSFAFLNIDTHPTNDPNIVPEEVHGDVNTQSSMSFNKFACKYIQESIINPIINNGEIADSAADVASVVYNEFIRYAKGDGKDLGIVLTPEHISDLMVEILELNHDDILLDICTGTGAFLVSGMKKKLEVSKNEEEEGKCLEGLIGVEFQPHMYSLATANLLFNNATISNLYLGSCFDEKIVNKIKTLKPTKAILNPPYGMKEKGFNELNFIKHALSFLPVGGKCVAIIPTTCGIKSNSNVNELKEAILENNTLDAIIKMDPKLFKEKASTATSIYVFTAGIKHDRPTIFIDGSSVIFSKIRNKLIDHDEKWPNLKKQILNDLKIKKKSEITKLHTFSKTESWEYPEEFIFELFESDFNKESILKQINNINNYYNF